MILLCEHYYTTSSIVPIFLSGLGGALIASLSAILYDRWEKYKINRNLFKGFISEMEANKEYLTHNYNLANKTKGENKYKISTFIPVETIICSNILTSGEIKLKSDDRKSIGHYLVTLDHLNQMISAIKTTSETAPEYELLLKQLSRYCRKEKGKDIHDFVWQYIDEIKDNLFKQKPYLKEYFE